MPDRSFPGCAICRRILATCLLIILTISTNGCQTSSQASQVAPSPSPVTSAGLASFSTDRPAPSVDSGTLVVHLGDGAIWLLAEDETPRFLTHGRNPRLSPDGCLVVFGQPSPDPPYHGEHWVVGVKDSAASRLFPPRDGWGGLIYGLAWSPDSKSLAVTTGGDIKRVYGGDLWLADVSDGAMTQVTESGAGEPVFSPDGEWIATFTPEIGWSHGTIGLWHVESKSGQTLFSPLMLQYLAWSEDSSGFAVALQRHDAHGLELWWVPVDDEPMQLGRLSNASYASWQPGAERLVFYSPKIVKDPENQTARSFHSLYLANRDGSGLEQVPGSEEMTFLDAWALDITDTSPWSSDGLWLLTVDRDGNNYIVDTSTLHTPLHLNADRVHGWLDATHYLASAYQLGKTELYRCLPPENCESLAQLAGEIQGLSYAEKACIP